MALAAALLLGLAPAADAQSISTDIGPVPADAGYWLLTEFDWGDARDLVDESVQIAPGFVCYKVRQHCQITRVSVDGEDVLARFHYGPTGGLDRIAFVTPDLDRAQADSHLARVGKVLSDYVQRFQGKPDVAFGALDVAAIQEGTPTPLAYWKRPEMEIRVEAGRKGEAYYVGAFFAPPLADPKAAAAGSARPAP